MKGVEVDFTSGEWWFKTWFTDGWTWHEKPPMPLGCRDRNMSFAQIRRRLQATGLAGLALSDGAGYNGASARSGTILTHHCGGECVVAG